MYEDVESKKKDKREHAADSYQPAKKFGDYRESDDKQYEYDGSNHR